MTAPADIPNAIVEKLARRCYDAGVKAGPHPASAPGWSALAEPSKDRFRATARADLAAVWSDIRLPDPTGGCVCSFESEDRGGGHSELVPEYEPACPVHSEHVYDPKTGVWVLRSEIEAAALDEAAAKIESKRTLLGIASRALDIGQAWSAALLRGDAKRLRAGGAE